MQPEDTFTENQRIIYEIAKEYIRKNPHFTINEIFSFAKRVSKLSADEIMKILNNFIKKKVIIPGSRLTRDSLLQNETRKRIYDYISDNPGTNFTQMITYIDIGPYAGRWHLEMLKRFGFIREQNFAKYKIYYREDFPKDKELIIFTLRNPKIFKIYSVLKNQPLKPNDLSVILDFPYSTTQYQLKKLQQNKLVKVNPDNMYSINTELFYFLQQYFDFTLSPELTKKLATYVEPQKPVAPPTEEKIRVLREYDYFGGNIRYKVAVQNTTNMTISKIDIMITATSQYTLDEKVQTIDHLVPGETRGVDFILTPLTCGKSQVYSTLAYTDGVGKPQSVVVDPKEVWIKCPLVSPQKVMENQITEWKKNLLKGSSIIPLDSIPPKQVFEVAHNQITALDLAEVIYNETDLRCVFSGIAKVTSTKMMVEAKVDSSSLVLDVWADNMKQATGFLAYIRNLINVALESAKQLMGRVEQLGLKILNIFEITNRLLQLYAFCDDLWIISEILTILKEIKTRIHRIFPDLEVLDQINNWIDNLSTTINLGDTIRENESLRLQTSTLRWLNQLIRLARSNIGNFSDTFKEQDSQIQHFNSLLSDLEDKYNTLVKKVIDKILIHLIIIHKKSGLCLFEFNFQATKTDTDLMSGFLTAIQQFGKELSEDISSVRKIEYHGFEINLEDGQLARAALILKGASPDLLKKKLGAFMKDFEEKHESAIENFKGDIDVFRDSISLVEKYFKITTD